VKRRVVIESLSGNFVWPVATKPDLVIPAKAGTQCDWALRALLVRWIPAYAGMTKD